eukprot:scaffold843_cov330-Pavlova_lutheri.AAC.20
MAFHSTLHTSPMSQLQYVTGSDDRNHFHVASCLPRKRTGSLLVSHVHPQNRNIDVCNGYLEAFTWPLFPIREELLGDGLSMEVDAVERPVCFPCIPEMAFSLTCWLHLRCSSWHPCTANNGIQVESRWAWRFVWWFPRSLPSRRCGCCRCGRCCSPRRLQSSSREPARRQRVQQWRCCAAWRRSSRVRNGPKPTVEGFLLSVVLTLYPRTRQGKPHPNQTGASLGPRSERTPPDSRSGGRVRMITVRKECGWTGVGPITA